MYCNVQRAIFAIEYPYPNVSAVIAQDIIGHGSEAVSRNYTHVDADTKRAAIVKLPDITKL